MLGTIWQTVFKGPIADLLLWLTSLTGNMGIAIVLLTLIIQLVLTPLRIPSLKSAQKMKAIKPELDKLKDKHSDDQMALAQAQMELYKQHGVSPFSGIITMVLSIPVILALYRVLLTTLQNGVAVSTSFLWFDLTQSDPYFILPVVVGISQYFTTKLMRPSNNSDTSSPPASSSSSTKEDKEESLEDTLQNMMGQMSLIFPLFSAGIVATLPSGVGIYWLISILFNAVQQKLVAR